ncbi:hypothetical protein ABLN85_19885 [Mycobacterium tuberculosis]
MLAVVPTALEEFQRHGTTVICTEAKIIKGADFPVRTKKSGPGPAQVMAMLVENEMAGWAQPCSEDTSRIAGATAALQELGAGCVATSMATGDDRRAAGQA